MNPAKQLPVRGVLMALDPGTRRVGVAVTDPLQVTARPLTTLPGAKLGALLDALPPLLLEHEVQGLLIGHPLLEGGQRGAQAQRAETLHHLASRRWPDLPAVLWDERWSSAAADEALRMADRAVQRLGRDAVAAAVILRSFLDARAH